MTPFLWLGFSFFDMVADACAVSKARHFMQVAERCFLRKYSTILANPLLRVVPGTNSSYSWQLQRIEFSIFVSLRQLLICGGDVALTWPYFVSGREIAVAPGAESSGGKKLKLQLRLASSHERYKFLKPASDRFQLLKSRYSPKFSTNESKTPGTVPNSVKTRGKIPGKFQIQ